MTEDEFRKQVTAKGYGEPRVKEFTPNLNSDMHEHEFALFGLVTRGTLTLGFNGGAESVYVAGECCELPAGTVHSERTGSDGATFLIATR